LRAGKTKGKKTGIRGSQNIQKKRREERAREKAEKRTVDKELQGREGWRVQKGEDWRRGTKKSRTPFRPQVRSGGSNALARTKRKRPREREEHQLYGKRSREAEEHRLVIAKTDQR